MKNINILLFDDFTTLDALGPAEVFGRLNNLYQINYFSFTDGLINNSTHLMITTKNINEISENGILVIPGGFGTRRLVNDTVFINKIKNIAENSEYVLCICTGSALLAKTGLLNKKKATSNKLSWEWVISQNTEVNWIKKARWVVDEKYYTSSGVTAGIDMSLGFISDKHGIEIARKISNSLEYIWNENKDVDPFVDVVIEM